jgi:cell division protein FtsL
MATMALAGREMEQMARQSAGRSVSIQQRNRELFELQQVRRRGPTPEMFFTKHIDNSRLVKADDPERRKEMRIFTVVVSVFCCLLMVYVWQHFSAIEVGYKIEAQKQQADQLREANRQLRLQEAQLSDPGRIDRIAKQLGLDVPLPGQVVRPDGTPVQGDGTVVARMETGRF